MFKLLQVFEHGDIQDSCESTQAHSGMAILGVFLVHFSLKITSKLLLDPYQTVFSFRVFVFLVEKTAIYSLRQSNLTVQLLTNQMARLAQRLNLAGSALFKMADELRSKSSK